MKNKYILILLFLFSIVLTGCNVSSSSSSSSSEYSNSDQLSSSGGSSSEWGETVEKQSEEVKQKSMVDVSSYVDQFRKEQNDMLDQFRTSKTSSKIKLCLAKSETIKLMTEGLHALEFLGKILAIFFVFLVIFDLFIKNHSRSENGALTGVLSALAYTFIIIFLINLDSVAVWWQTDIVDVFLKTCKIGKPTEGLIMSLVLGQFIYLILFLSRVFGSVIIIMAIFKAVSTPQGAESNLAKAGSWFIGGLMLGMMPSILKWAGIFS